jgi:hypothetical protein
MCSLGLIDELMSLLATEEDYTAKESLVLLKAMMSPYSRQFIREVPGLPPALIRLVKLYTDEVIAFVLAAILDDHQTVIPSNQVFFSQLLPAVAALALPALATQIPHVPAQALLVVLITRNKLLVRKALNLQLGAFDLAEVAAGHALTSAESRLFLSKLIQESADVQPAVINKFTAIPGFEVSQGSVRPLNWLLLEAFGKPAKCIELCELLEMLVYDNPLSKELAQSLPIDMRSSTLRSQLSDLFVREVSVPSSALVSPLARLFFVWMDAGLAAKVFDKVVSVLPQLAALMQQPDSGLLSAFLGALVLQRPDEAGVFKGTLSLQGWLKSLETLTRDKALEVLAVKSDMVGSAGIITSCFAKVFAKEYPRLRKQLLALYVEEDRPEEAVPSSAEANDLRNRLAEAQTEIELLRTTTASVRLNCASKVRGLMEALVEAEWKAEASQERIWRLERDSQSSEGQQVSPSDVYLEHRLAQAEAKNQELLELVGLLTSQSSGALEPRPQVLGIESSGLEIVQARNMPPLTVSRLSAVTIKAEPKGKVTVGAQTHDVAKETADGPVIRGEAYPVQQTGRRDAPSERLETPTIVSPPAKSDVPSGRLETSTPVRPPAKSDVPSGRLEASTIAPPPIVSFKREAPTVPPKPKVEPTSRPKITAPAALSSPFAAQLGPIPKVVEELAVPVTKEVVMEETVAPVTKEVVSSSFQALRNPFEAAFTPRVQDTARPEPNPPKPPVDSPQPTETQSPERRNPFRQPAVEAKLTTDAQISQTPPARSGAVVSSASTKTTEKSRPQRPSANPFFAQEVGDDALSFFDKLPQS